MAAIENRKRPLRPVEDVLAEVWQALWRVDTIRFLDLNSVSLSIEAGVLLLEGHLASEASLWHIRAVARNVPGVLAIHDHLVVDRDLAVEVAQALASDGRTRPLVLPVACDHGWIRLGGEVPDRGVQQAAEDVAAQVPHGRGVVALPRVTGEPPTPMRRALQPRPGARVWGEDGEVGLVAQVVINPHNRLVTDFVVASGGAHDSRSLQGGYVVPIEAIEIANADSVFLTHPYRTITSFPALDVSAYPQPPSTWLPPYPYNAPAVRWRQESQHPAVELPTSRLEPSERLQSSQTPDSVPGHRGTDSRDSELEFIKEVRHETPGDTHA
jgi:hypothetical protein